MVFPGRRTWLPDAGCGNRWGDSNLLGGLLAGYLEQNSLELHTFVMSHAHIDHAGAVSALVEGGGYASWSLITLYRNDSTSWDPRRLDSGNGCGRIRGGQGSTHQARWQIRRLERSLFRNGTRVTCGRLLPCEPHQRCLHVGIPKVCLLPSPASLRRSPSAAMGRGSSSSSMETSSCRTRYR